MAEAWPASRRYVYYMAQSRKQPKSFDHVALWVSERERIASFLCSYLGVHKIESTDSFTLIGAHAREGKITLFDAEGPREAGALERIVLRVSDLDAALAQLPADVVVTRTHGGVAEFEVPGGLSLGLVQRNGDLDYDLDHAVLRARDTTAVAAGFEALGFERDGDRLIVKDREIRLVQANVNPVERPLLNHIALLVESADDHIVAAQSAGIEIEDIKDAPNTYAGFVRGPEGIRLEFVEHKPNFSLT